MPEPETRLCQKSERVHKIEESFVKYVTRKRKGGGSSVFYSPILKAWVKCEKRVTRGERG